MALQSVKTSYRSKRVWKCDIRTDQSKWIMKQNKDSGKGPTSIWGFNVRYILYMAVGQLGIHMTK